MVCEEEASSMSKRKRKSSGLSNDRTNMDNCSGFDNLPNEILAEIMFRLQPKSLMSLKSLNKSWYFVIRCLTKDPDFIANHQRHAKARSPMLLINLPPHCHCRDLQAPLNIEHGSSKPVPLVPRKKKPSRVVTSMFITQFIDNGDDEGGKIRCVSEHIGVSGFPDFLVRRGQARAEVFHCNGVICLTNDLKTLTLYNPIMGDFETFDPKPGGDVRGYGDRVHGMGFGSDSRATDFKVVRILGPNIAQVFTPGTSDSWRRIKFSVRVNSYWSLRDHLYLKGYCFWLMNSLSVVCFDVCSEAFHEIPLPNELERSGESIYDPNRPNLTACNGSVCLFWYFPKEFIDIWVMDVKNEGGCNGDFDHSWRKWLRIDRFEGFLRPLTFWRSDEILMETKYRKIALYNVGTRKQKSLSIDDVLGHCVFFFDRYVNSLASINWMIKHIRPNRNIESLINKKFS